jgi:two-component system chemotaxis sensor kinase CheA
MQLQHKRIFLVEDNIGNLTIVKILLEAHGAVVATHRSGQDVLPHLRSFLPVDLIILDLVLPSGVTGYDIFSAIRNQSEFDGVPIVAMSFIDRSKAIPEVKKRGFSGYIGKPISFQDFPKQIGDILAGQSIW